MSAKYAHLIDSLEKPVQEGNFKSRGIILQVCVDEGAKKILLPAPSAGDFFTVPADLILKVQPIFYLDPIDAVYKALGVS